MSAAPLDGPLCFTSEVHIGREHPPEFVGLLRAASGRAHDRRL